MRRLEAAEHLLLFEPGILGCVEVLGVDEDELQFSRVARHACVVLDDCFFVLQMGFDPEWSRHQIGSVLFFETLTDLERDDPAVRRLDYMSGVTTFKLRTINEKLPTRSYRLFPRTPIGACRYTSLSLTNAASKFVGRALDRVQLKTRVKSLIQGMNRRAAAPEPQDRKL